MPGQSSSSFFPARSGAISNVQSRSQGKSVGGLVGSFKYKIREKFFMKKALMAFIVMLVVIYVSSLIGHNIFKSSEFSVLVSIAAASAVIGFFNSSDGDKK